VAGFGAGAWDNFIGNVDNVSVGFSGSTTTFDFEPTQTVLVVTPSNLQGWVPVTSGTSTITFEPGPATPPLGGGSVELAVGSDGSGAAQLRHPSMDGTLLADLTQLSYSAYVDQDGSGGQAPYIILSVDYDGNGTTDDLLFFEPIYQGATFCPSNVQGPLVVDTWQTWNATAGCWWSLNNTAGAGPGTNVKPLSTILAAQPNARLATDTTGAIRIVAGFGAGAWDNFIGNVDNVSIGSGSTSTVYDFEPEPAITIADIAQNEGNAGTTNFVFTLTLSQAVSQTVTVQYATADGTATVADGDYIATSGTATFAPGTTTTTVTVQVVGDVKLEADETFFLNLTSPQLATVTPPDDQAQATILNDDPVPTITITDVTQAEGNAGTTNFVFTLALSNPSATTVTVNAATADGTASSASDYTAVNTIVTFAPGTVVQTVSVPVIGDLVLETDETFFVNLSGATGATILDNQGLGTITNDDAAPTFSINDVSQAEGDAGTTAFTFTVTLTGSSALTATVDFATADGTATAGTDYTATSGTLTFAPGVTTQTITVNVTGDVTFEPDETFFLNLSNPTNATISDAQGLGTITTDDAGVADLSITKSGTATQFQGQAISYTITVSNAGPQDAPNTIVTDTLPAGSTFGSATPSQGSCTGTGPVTCNLGVVANGATATITLTVTAPFTGTTATNTATVTSGASDPDLTDNTATATTTLTPAAAIPTLSQWMLLALAAMFAVTALLRLRM
ncbi:MAG TPA: Calx-beta domain-containing protein, partial [Thermoanaerobaculia bacterium]